MNLIIILLSIFFIFTFIILEYNTYKIDKKNIFTIYPKAGLSNKLRVIFGWLKCKDKIRVYWNVDQACNGKFTDIFEPIENVEIVETSLTYGLYINPLYTIIDLFFYYVIYPMKFDYYGFEDYKKIMEKNNIHYSLYEEKEIYKKLKIKSRLNNIVNEFIKKNNLQDGISLHVRRTDHVSLAQNSNNYSDDQEFFDFIDKFPNNTTIFLATDNLKTQEQFIERYGKRLFYYKKIKEGNNLRKTSLEDAVIDIFIAARIKNFKGSKHSSYSELIEVLH
jgi:hypothetical protein